MKLNHLILMLGFVPLALLVQGADPKSAVPFPQQLRVPAATHSGPRIEFASLLHDFGRIMSGQVYEHAFVFTNRGDQTLFITNITTSCNCTMTKTWDRRIEPGKSGAIPLQFNPASLKGAFLRNVTVLCNDPLQPVLRLQLKGTVWEPIEVTPSYVVFNTVVGVQTNLTRSVRIVNNLDTPLTLSEPVCTNQAFHSELKTEQAGKKFELQVSPVLPLKLGRTQSAITLQTSSTNFPVIKINAITYVQPPVMVSPSSILLPAGPLPDARKITLIIRNLGSDPLSVFDYAVNVPGADISLHPILPGRLFNLVVTFPAGLQIQPQQTIAITAKSDHPQYSLIQVPVRQHPAPAPRPVAMTAPQPVVAPTAPLSPPGILDPTTAALQPIPSPTPEIAPPKDDAPLLGTSTTPPPLPVIK